MIASCSSTPGPSGDEAARLDRLTDDYWEWNLERSPRWATYLGDRRYEDRLADLHRDALEREVAKLEEFRRELATIDRGGLDAGSAVTAEVFEVTLAGRLGEYRHGFHQTAVDQMYGPQVDFLELASFHPIDEPGRAAFLTRLQAFPDYLDGYLENLEDGLAAGNTAPRVVVDRVIGQLEGVLATPVEECALVGYVDRIPATVREEIAPDFRDEVVAAVRDHVYPPYRRMLAFLQDEYAPRARTQDGIGDGAAYRHRIGYHTSLEYTPEELHRLGLDILEDIERQMIGIARRLGHDGDLESFNEKLRADPANFYATRAEVLADAEANLERANAKLPKLFGRLPKVGCGVKAIEPYSEQDAPAAYYYSGSDDGSRPGMYYVNTYQPESRLRFNMPALSLHEAVPGHHLQIALAKELPLPPFRRHAHVTAFVEGWALYSELLGDEVGLYRDDLARYGMLTYQAWRASRLVVDTGIHAMGWDRERAIEFFRDNVAISEKEIENEIDRYIMWPGQALAYMVGCVEIRKLRRRAEERLGDRFDLRAFHDVVLENGAIPLSVLRTVVDRWIERTNGAAPEGAGPN